MVVVAHLVKDFGSRQAIDYKGSVPGYDDRAVPPNCDSHGHPMEKKLSVSANAGNLYGSTPQSRYLSADPRRNDPSRPAGRAIDIFRADPHSVNQLDFHDFGDGFEPGHIVDDYVGPAMELVCGDFPLKRFNYFIFIKKVDTHARDKTKIANVARIFFFFWNFNLKSMFYCEFLVIRRFDRYTPGPRSTLSSTASRRATTLYSRATTSRKITCPWDWKFGGTKSSLLFRSGRPEFRRL